MRKLKVECGWCFWNGSRSKNKIGIRCPKCRKSHTVEPFDPVKVYSDEEFERHRKMKMIAAGAKEIRSGIWISTSPRICTNRSLKKLKEFDDYYWLYKLLTKECIALWIGRARRNGKRFAQIGDAFVEIGNNGHRRLHRNQKETASTPRFREKSALPTKDRGQGFACGLTIESALIQ